MYLGALGSPLELKDKLHEVGKSGDHGGSGRVGRLCGNYVFSNLLKKKKNTSVLLKSSELFEYDPKKKKGKSNHIFFKTHVGERMQLKYDCDGRRCFISAIKVIVDGLESGKSKVSD